MMKNTGWLAIVFAVADITKTCEIDYELHHNLIVHAINAHESSSSGIMLLGSLIARARRERNKQRTFHFEQLPGDTRCLREIFRGQEGEVLLGLYRHYGVEITAKKDSLTINTNPRTVTLAA